MGSQVQFLDPQTGQFLSHQWISRHDADPFLGKREEARSFVRGVRGHADRAYSSQQPPLGCIHHIQPSPDWTLVRWRAPCLLARSLAPVTPQSPSLGRFGGMVRPSPTYHGDSFLFSNVIIRGVHHGFSRSSSARFITVFHGHRRRGSSRVFKIIAFSCFPVYSTSIFHVLF